MRAIAATFLGLTLATAAAAQPMPQNQAPTLEQRGQQLLQGLTGNQNQNARQTAPGTYDRDRDESGRSGNTQRSYRDQRQPDQGYRGQGDSFGNTQRPYQGQRQPDQGYRDRDDRYGNADRPYRDQRQPNQNSRGPAYDPGARPSPGYQSPRN